MANELSMNGLASKLRKNRIFNNKQTIHMNTKSLLMFGFSAALLAGCSSDNVLPNGGDGDLSGDAYVSISLHLPTTTGLRAENDNYNQGDPKEYKVNSLAVLYFDSSDNFIQAQSVDKNALDALNGGKTPPTTATGITIDYDLPVQKVPNNARKVLVLINPSTSNINVANITATDFSSLNSVLSVDDNASCFTGNSKDNFFMSNSPLSDGTVLVNVIPQPTPELAQTSKKNVFVERAVAKVTLDETGAIGKTQSWKYTIPRDNNGVATSHENDIVEFQNWALDVVNRKEYPVRKIQDAWMTDEYKISDGTTSYQRFISKTQGLSGNTAEAYRTYWAEDPNYTDGAEYVDGQVSKSGKSIENFHYIDNTEVNNEMEGIAYCAENTFDVTNMKQGETTRVVFKAKYTPKSNLVEGTTSIDGTWYMVGTSNTAFTKENIEELVLKAINKTNPSDAVTKVTLKDLPGGKLNSQDKEFSNDLFTVIHTTETTAKVLSDEELNIVKATLPQIITYKDGYCYYVARIQHFGNELTPWTTGEDYRKNNNDMRHKYLGRYGVVRNNWYQMSLNTVSGPGTPDIPEIPDDKDDEQNYYLQTTVKIMDWAVRKQTLDF